MTKQLIKNILKILVVLINIYNENLKSAGTRPWSVG
jgi:hypothetical protein